MTDLSKMTKKQLERLIKDAERALKTLTNKDKREARKAAEKAAAKFGFTLDELSGGAEKPAPAKRGRPRKAAPKKASAAKYANPADKSQTWTGKGRQPQWYKDAIASGADPKNMEI